LLHINGNQPNKYNIRYYHKDMNVCAPNQDMDVRYLGFIKI
jgi:hypothetical protein